MIESNGASSMLDVHVSSRMTTHQQPLQAKRFQKAAAAAQHANGIAF